MIGMFVDFNEREPKITESRKSATSCRNRGRTVSSDLTAAEYGSFTSMTTVECVFPGRCVRSGLCEKNAQYLSGC